MPTSAETGSGAYPPVRSTPTLVFWVGEVGISFIFSFPRPGARTDHRLTTSPEASEMAEWGLGVIGALVLTLLRT